MKNTIYICLLLFSSVSFANTQKEINSAVKNSKTIKLALNDLHKLGMSCSIGIDEDGQETIQFLTKKVNGVNRSTFRAMYPCSNGQSAIFDGVLGDNGTVAVYYFELLYAN